MQPNYKLFCLIVLLLFFVNFSSSAQTQGFGLMFGAGSTSMSGYSGSSERFDPVYFGIQTRSGSGPVFFEANLIYSRRGINLDSTVSQSFVKLGDDRQILNYLSVPLLAGLEVTNWFYIQGGFYASALLGARYKIPGLLTPSAVIKNKEEFAGSDFGTILGFGFNIGESAGFGMRYTRGSKDINANPRSRSTIYLDTDKEVNTSSFQFFITIYL